MKKYRARLTSGRVVGPFPTEGIQELAEKRHIDGSEEFQEFPTGDWGPLEKFPELKAIVDLALERNASGQQPPEQEATFVKKLSELGIEKAQEQSDSESEFPREFSFEIEESNPKTEGDESGLFELEEEEEGEDEDEIELNNEEDSDEEVEEELNSENLEETEVYAKNRRVAEYDQDKTVVNPDTLRYLEEQKRIEAEKAKKIKEEELQKIKEEPKVDLDNDSTEMISLASLKKELTPKISESESELEQEALEKKKAEEEKALIALEAKKESEEQEEEQDEAPQKKKKKMIVLFAAVALAVVFLLPEDKKQEAPKQIKVVYPQIVFPQQYETPDLKKADVIFKKGVSEQLKGTYPAEMKAAEYYKESLENQFKENPAAAKLIFTYSDLLKHSNDPVADANRTFKLIQVFSAKASKDPNLSAAFARFYLAIGKAPASIKTIEKFNTIKNSNPTLDLFAVYLSALMNNGELVKAKAVEEKLAQAKGKTLFTNKSLFDYYFFKGEYEKAAEVLVEMEKNYGASVAVMLRKASLFIYKEDFQSLEKLLDKIRLAGAEGSKVYYAKYLEYRGLAAAKKGDAAKALEAFKKALELNESPELRSRLASLTANSSKETNDLINESKAIELIAKSKGHWRKGNYKFAFSDALEATRLVPDFLPAQLHLAKLQIGRSYYSEAIKSLEDLYEKHPHNPDVVFGLIDAYIEAYKFDKVKKLLNILATSDLRRQPEYFSKMAKYYVFRDEFSGAVAWLQQAINLNPLDDENTFELAKMFIRYRKYNQGKVLLNKAMDLDPANVDYRVSYADILYETDSANSAIGYLYDVLRDFPDNAKILSAIGIYYYRSGQIKMFQATKDKLLKLPNKDTTLFEFLIKAAKIDEKFDDVVKYSDELIKINPGDLRTRLFLGQIFMEMSKYKEALEQFNAIKERLDTYPKLQYNMSRLYLLTDNVPKATELAKEEVIGNPGGIDGYLLLAEIYQKQEKYLDAEKQYKEAQKINPKNVDMLVGLAYINFMKSQYEIALDLFKKAKRFEPGRAETHKLLGDVYRKIGQSTLAVESYKMFLELSPNSRYKENLQNYINMMQ